MENGAAHPYFQNHETGFEQYIKENPIDIEMQKLCFEVFMRSPEGQKLYIMILENYLIPAMFSPEHPHASNLALYFEGFKEAFRGLMNMAKIHKQRIENS